MTAFTIPPKQTVKPLILNSGDTLTVNAGGRSEDVTVNADATETVNNGSSFRTTVNDGGKEFVNGGKIDFTTLNGGGVILDHATADHTRINFSVLSPFSQMDVSNHSVAKNTIIEGGGILTADHGLLVDATSTAENVTFEKPSGKGATLALGNPQSFTGFIKGLSVGDVLQFGDASISSITVSSFQLTNNQHDLTITYNDASHTGLHATYHLTDLQPGTTFQLTQGMIGGLHLSDLTVVKTVGIADVHHDVGLLV
jgi:autotransporter passenger strand-loop-strand repeat protein